MKRTPLKRRSKKYGKELDRYYQTVKPAWLNENPVCQFETSHGRPCGSDRLVTIHHTMRRGKFLNDTRYFVTLCGYHHDYVETHKKKARELGYILYK